MGEDPKPDPIVSVLREKIHSEAEYDGGVTEG